MSELYSALDQAMSQRKSVRGFRPDPIEPDQLRKLFAVAQRAPSWCNIQPWRVVVTSPPMTETLRQTLVAAAKSGLPSPDVPFPIEYPEPYGAHRKACGRELYTAMGIPREDRAKRYDAWLRNYEIFDAPHCAIVSRDQRLGEYATLDVGVWLGTLVAAAAVMGIDLCPMASLAAYPGPVRELLEIPKGEQILFGIALGVEDPEVAANACRTTREPVESNVRFVG